MRDKEYMFVLDNVGPLSMLRASLMLCPPNNKNKNFHSAP